MEQQELSDISEDDAFTIKEDLRDKIMILLDDMLFEDFEFEPYYKSPYLHTPMDSKYLKHARLQ